MARGVAVDQPVGEPTSGRLADETADCQRNAEQQTGLGGVEVVKLWSETRHGESEKQRAVGVGRHVVDAGDDDGPVLEHPEVV